MTPSLACGKTSTADWTVVPCLRPVESTFVVSALDPLFTMTADNGGVPRSFPDLIGDGSGVLLSNEQGEYKGVWEFELGSDFDGWVWAFEQGRPWSSPFAWRIDTMDWIEAPVSLTSQNQAKLAEDGPTFGWSNLGQATLESGKHTIEIRATGQSKDGLHLLWIDRFILIDRRTGPGVGPPFLMANEIVPPNVIWLWKGHASGEVRDDFRPRIDPYFLDNPADKPTVVVLPGGGFVGRAMHEQGVIAQRFNELGFNAAVVQYRISPHRWPDPIVDCARAVRYLRANAGQWGIDPNKIAVCGFSAGGHIASMLGVHGECSDFDGGDELDRLPCRPNALILCYPLLDCSWRLPLLVGERFSAADAFKADPIANVTSKVPPTFMWHTAQDTGVPPATNTIPFAQALAQAGVPYELHIYEKGAHGIGLGDALPAGQWSSSCATWLHGLFF